MEDSGDVNVGLLHGDEFDVYHEPKDSFFVEFAKRMYAISPLLLMTYSTINQVFVIAKSVSSQSSVETYYNRFVGVESNGQETYYTCEYGNAEAVVVYCPYYTIDAFIGIIVVWSIYFAVFITVRFVVTFKYATDDLRFYIAVDQFNSHWLNKSLVYIGAGLTVISLIVGVYYMSPDSEWNSTVDNESLLNMILFLGINTLALSGFRKQFINPRQIEDMADFDTYVPLFNVKFYYGVERVITPILVAYMQLLTTDNDTELKLHGDVKILRKTLTKLYKLE